MQLIIIFNSVKRREKGLRRHEIYERGSAGKSSRGFLLKFDSIVIYVGKRQKNVPFILINKRDWLDGSLL